MGHIEHRNLEVTSAVGPANGPDLSHHRGPGEAAFPELAGKGS